MWRAGSPVCRFEAGLLVLVGCNPLHRAPLTFAEAELSSAPFLGPQHASQSYAGIHTRLRVNSGVDRSAGLSTGPVGWNFYLFIYSLPPTA
jgi:hypothetical protein